MTNLSPLHRALRVLCGAAIISASVLWLALPLALAGALCGAAIAVTGFSGHCPACHVASRLGRPEK